MLLTWSGLHHNDHAVIHWFCGTKFQDDWAVIKYTNMWRLYQSTYPYSLDSCRNHSHIGHIGAHQSQTYRGTSQTRGHKLHLLCHGDHSHSLQEGQERLKRQNTLGCLDQYAAQNSKHARPPIPSQPPTQKVFFQWHTQYDPTMKHSHCETVYAKELFRWLFFELVHSLRILSILPTYRLAGLTKECH